jgi:hypothetical protein
MLLEIECISGSSFGVGMGDKSASLSGGILEEMKSVCDGGVLLPLL